MGLSPQNNHLKSEKIGVTRLGFIYVKRAKVKNNVISYLGFPEYGVTNASNYKWGFTTDSNPKRDNTKKGNLKDITLFKNAKAKQTVL